MSRTVSMSRPVLSIAKNFTDEEHRLMIALIFKAKAIARTDSRYDNQRTRRRSNIPAQSSTDYYASSTQINAIPIT
ncbi:MAG TPA: hypothetical protein VEH06_07005 [Candidatus Bathyarchaeia archaeon]|nr:hypothetical protein [Candidatus Bathyarchaeia archaeon]